MKVTLGLLSEKIHSLGKSSVVFANEKPVHLFAFALMTILMELFLLTKENSFEFQRGLFLLSSISFFFLFTLLKAIFNNFVSDKLSSILSVLPGVLVFALLLNNRSLSLIATAVIFAAVLRLIFFLLPNIEKVTGYGIFVLDALAIFMWFRYNLFAGSFFTDKLLMAILVVLTLKTISKFPIHYFALLALLIISIPMPQTPINWQPVIGVIGKISAASESAGYMLSGIFDKGSYSTGYGSLQVTGGRLFKKEKTQLLLTTNEKPYFVYTDLETGSQRKIRRTVYFKGGEGTDKKGLVDFLALLHSNQVDSKTAALFSQLSRFEEEYYYLNTKDEIAPANTIILKDEKGNVESGVSENNHRKGYTLTAIYLDIDYGSPYLIDLYENTAHIAPMTYQEATSYMDSLYDLDLKTVISQEEYDALIGNYDVSDYLDTKGASTRMKELAEELNSGTHNQYETCKAIEGYLRQYTYSTNAVGGHNPDSDLTTAQGMSDIADRFLFETEEGYCVHYTSSMVMLLRLAGIPARVENGYRYSMPFEKQNQYVVTSNLAHVWPEAYIENVGWVPFEPTSAYNTPEKYTWHRFKEDKEQEELLTEDITVPDLPDTDEKDAYQQEQNDKRTIIKLVIIVLTSIVVLLIVIILSTILYRKIRYKFATPEEKLKLDVEMIKKQLVKKSEDKFNDRGILTDYLTLAPEYLRSDLSEIINLYYKVMYSEEVNFTITEDESVKIKNMRMSLK